MAAAVRSVYDAIVIGAGPIGAVAALSLAKNASLRSVLCVDGRPQGALPRLENSAPSPKHTTVAPSAQEFLRELGALSEWLDRSATPYTSMHVWDSRTDGIGVTFQSSDVGLPSLGSVVELEHLEHAATDALLQHPCAELQRGTRVDTMDLPVSYSGNLVRVSFNDGSDALARLVVGADGTNSLVRRLSGLRVTQHHYDQHAVAATVAAPNHGERALQRFLPTGPLALLPLRDGHAGIVWSTRPHECERLMQLPDAQFAAEVFRALKGAGEYAPSSKGLARERGIPDLHVPDHAGVIERVQAPLRLLRSPSSTHRVALVGDAARTIHPLAGQGMNLGLRDCKQLAQRVAHSAALGLDWGDERVLSMFQQDANRQSIPVEAGVHLMQRAANLQTGVPLSLALWAAEMTPFARSTFASYATGVKRS